MKTILLLICKRVNVMSTLYFQAVDLVTMFDGQMEEDGLVDSDICDEDDDGVL